jgi:hypothetical protein
MHNAYGGEITVFVHDEEWRRKKAAYVRAYRARKIAEDPTWRDKEREWTNRSIAKRLANDPDAKNRVVRARRARIKEQNPETLRVRNRAISERRRQRRLEDPKWHELEKSKQREKNRRHLAKMGPIRREAMRVYALKKRLESLAIFGSKCKRCGFDDYRALEVDHIHGNGHADPVAGYGRWIKLISLHKKHGLEWLSQHFQILCSNCHRIKTHENGDWTRHRRRD